MPVLTNPPPELNLSIHQIVEILKASQQQEIRGLQDILTSLQHEQIYDLTLPTNMLRQGKIELIEHLILMCQAKLQGIQLIDNMNSTIEYTLSHQG